MSLLICPVCGEPLLREERSYTCPRGHSFDIARQGYVNLLRSNQSSARRHGDDKPMVLARQAFLERGYYLPLREALCRAAERYAPAHGALLDAGCGEGWYTAAVRATRPNAPALGVDISKEALIQAAKRRAGLELAVASVSALPVADGSCGAVLSVFAPDAPEEFRRVLAPGGVLLRVLPLEEHLLDLKAAVYDTPYPNPPAAYAPAGFRLLERLDLRDVITLEDPADIQRLFLMTPYYYKTSRRDQAKLAALPRLETRIAFGVFILSREA